MRIDIDSHLGLRSILDLEECVLDTLIACAAFVLERDREEKVLCCILVPFSAWLYIITLDPGERDSETHLL
jgi:hypothetical protein